MFCCVCVRRVRHRCEESKSREMRQKVGHARAFCRQGARLGERREGSMLCERKSFSVYFFAKKTFPVFMDMSGTKWSSCCFHHVDHKTRKPYKAIYSSCLGRTKQSRHTKNTTTPGTNIKKTQAQKTQVRHTKKQSRQSPTWQSLTFSLERMK